MSSAPQARPAAEVPQVPTVFDTHSPRCTGCNAFDRDPLVALDSRFDRVRLDLVNIYSGETESARVEGHVRSSDCAEQVPVGDLAVLTLLGPGCEERLFEDMDGAGRAPSTSFIRELG